MNSWSDELRALDRVEPTRDLWADALARAASPPSRARGGSRGLWSGRRRTVVLVAALGVAGLAAAGVIVLGSSTAAAAYAVTTNPNGIVTVTIRQFSALPALNRELTKDGVPLKAVPVTADCAFMRRRPRLGPQPFVAPETGAVGLPPSDTTTIDTSQLSSEGGVGVLGVEQVRPGRFIFMDAGTRSPGPSCINSAAFYSPEVRVTPLPVSRGKRVTLVARVRRSPVRRCTVTVYDRWKEWPLLCSGPQAQASRARTGLVDLDSSV